MLFFENSIIIKPSLGSCEVQQKNRSPTQGYKQKIQVRKLFTILNQNYTIIITVLYIFIYIILLYYYCFVYFYLWSDLIKKYLSDNFLNEVNISNRNKCVFCQCDYFSGGSKQLLSM